jgi:carboxymethylenebutenolidase
MGQATFVRRPDGSAFPAYLAVPATPGAGVVVCHAYWGLTPHYERLCDRFAALGYCAIAPSLYGGEASDVPEEADRLEQRMNEDQAESDVVATLDHLLALPGAVVGRVGAIGFSLGGWASTRLAAARPDVAAVAPFYGYSRAADYDSMRAAAQAHFVPDDDADPVWFERRLRGAGRAVQGFVYPDSVHGFFNEDHPEEYDRQAAGLAWERVVAFFSARLRPTRRS